MADIIQWADWANMQELITEGNAMVSGMSAEEAVAALGAKANSGLYVYNGATAAGASNIIEFPNAATAAEAATAYTEAGGTVSATGAAIAATGAAKSTANLTVIQGGAGASSSGVAGLLSVSLPTAAAALAPLAGVAVGAGLYTSNPELWTNISKTLLPFCYSDSELLPVVADANGNTYYSRDVINAIKEFISTLSPETKATLVDTSILDEPNTPQPIPCAAGQVTVSRQDKRYPENPYTSYNYSYRDNSSTVYIVCKLTRDTFTVNAYSKNNFTPVETYESGRESTSRVYRYGDYFVSVMDSISYSTWNITTTVPIYNQSLTTVGQEDIAKILFEGVVQEIYSTGLSKWNGDAYPDTASPINIFTGYDADGNPMYSPYYPVTTPIGDPGTSTDPDANPDPSTNPDPAPAIDPWISPLPSPSSYPVEVPISVPAPLPDPIPDEQPVPPPDIDPSEEKDETPPDDPEPDPDPTDEGVTPEPIIPVIPIPQSSANGLLHVYNPTRTQIDEFGAWLWTTFSGDLIDTLSKLFNDPMDAVIGLHELYATPATGGSTTIKCGFLDSDVSSRLVSTRYTTINCGSVVVEEYYQNYLDYSPYTQCMIYLPFVGIVPVSADDIIGNAVNITYHVDSYTGCCIAVVTVARSGYSSTVYQFNGNCAVEIPITSGYQSQLMSGFLGLVGTVASGGNPYVGMRASQIGSAGYGKNVVQHSGAFGASFGAMGCKKPYIIVRRPVQKKVPNYSLSYGYPAHKMVFVGNCTGYLRCREVRVTSTTATNVEKEMIVSALKAGVYVR